MTKLNQILLFFEIPLVISRSLSFPTPIPLDPNNLKNSLCFTVQLSLLLPNSTPFYLAKYFSYRPPFT